MLAETLVRTYVKNLSPDTWCQIIEDQHKLEADGFIGDCVLRNTAKEILRSMNSPMDDHIVLWMREIYIATLETIFMTNQENNLCSLEMNKK